MRLQLHKTALITVVLAIIATASVHASIIQYEYSGTYSTNNDIDPQELDGARFSLIYQIDSNKAPDNTGATFAAYTGSVVC